MAFRLSRRAFLAGVGGTAVSLPFLEVMGGEPAAKADVGTFPCRYLVCFAGVSIGTSGNRFVPDATGPGYDLKTALAPLGTRGVSDLVGVVSGLKIPWDTGGGAPAGGRPAGFHASTPGPLLSGVRSSDRDASARGPTSDQIVAEAFAGRTRFPSLEYRVQADAYRGGGSSKGRMSYKRDASGSIVPMTPIASPRLAYDSLFTGFVPDDPAEAERRRRLLEMDRSVLDLVSTNSERLMSRLGRTDRLRLERHFDEIRALETRLTDIPETPMSLCSPLTDPGDDASVAISTYGGDIAIGWADEDRRGRVMCDLIHMAFTCDLVRSASLMLTFAQSFLNVESIVGVRTDMHELGHGAGSLEQMSQGIAWNVDHFAYLVERMRDTPEGDGTLLDHSALAFVTEGGHGYDPESGENGKSHSSENMAALYAGHAGGLRPGRHIVAADRHPGSVLISCMRAVGVDTDLGEVSGGIDEMF